MVRRFWSEETGAVVSAEIMLVATILVLGAIVGLKSVRDSVVTELADLAQAIANVNQSYTYSGTQGHHAITAGGLFVDNQDFCDMAAVDCDQHSKCVVICTAVNTVGGNEGFQP